MDHQEPNDVRIDDEEVFEEDGFYDPTDDDEDLRQLMADKPEFRQYFNLTSDEAIEQMRKLVSETCVVSQLPPSICRVFLYKYKWDSKALINEYGKMDTKAFYEKNGLLPLSEVIFSLDLRTLGGIEIDEGDNSGKLVTCLVCFDDVTVDQSAKETCGHVICLSCWRDHVRFKIEKEGCGMFIMCPACPFIISDQFIRELMSDNKNVMDKMVESQLNAYVDSHPLLTWCPEKRCTGTIIRVDSTKWGPGPIICEKCTTEFCIVCKKNWHAPLVCPFVLIWEREVNSADRTAEWIQGNAKPCPKCQVPIEKNGGCNHMRCSNPACGYQFCWICLEKAHDHSFGDRCGKVSPEALQQIARQQNQNQQTLKELQHFIFHSERYLSHMRSMELESNLDTNTSLILDDAIRKYGTKIINIDRVGIAEAVRMLRSCRRMLAYGYAFLFYLPDSANPNEKLVYERNLNDLHFYTERLSLLLEQDLRKSLRYEADKFEKQRVEVIKIAQYCDERREKILTHVMRNCDNGMWDLTRIVAPAGTQPAATQPAAEAAQPAATRRAAR